MTRLAWSLAAGEERVITFACEEVHLLNMTGEALHVVERRGEVLELCVSREGKKGPAEPTR